MQNSDLLYPIETEYADDVDFIDESEENLKIVEKEAEKLFREDWNLIINTEKTESTKFFLETNKNDPTTVPAKKYGHP